jgi:membrane protein implicated in regulation of membrane protease activity
MLYFIVVGILLIITEMLTPGIFFFFTLGIAVILNSIVFKLTNDYTITLIGIAITTSIFYYLIKKFKVFSPKTDYKSNINAYVGKTAVVQEKTGTSTYRVKVFSEIWSAKSDTELNIGDICEVIGRENNTLIITKR